MQVEVLLTGVGGQGVQLCSKTLALAAVAEGRQAMMVGHYAGAIRGGQTDGTVVVADGPLRALPIIPSAWSAFVMSDEFWGPTHEKLRPGGLVVANANQIGHGLDHDGLQLIEVPAGQIANDLEAPMSAGYVLLGAFSSITGIVGIDALVEAMKKLVPPYRTQHLVANETTLRAGADAGPPLAAPAWSVAATSGAGR